MQSANTPTLSIIVVLFSAIFLLQPTHPTGGQFSGINRTPNFRRTFAPMTHNPVRSDHEIP
jgi:hypothetical protein